MTSKNLFWKVSQLNFKKRLPYFVLCFLAALFFMPVYTTLNCMTTASNMYQDQMYQELMQVRLSYAQLSLLPAATFGNGLSLLLCVIMAFMFAITAFSWNNAICKVDFYKALPIKENVRFAYIHLNSFLMFAICFGVNLVLSNLAVAYWGFYHPSYITASLISFLYHALFFLATYFLVSIAQQLTGSSILAFFGSSFLIGFESFLRIFVKSMKDLFYHTNLVQRDVLDLSDALFTPVGVYIKGYDAVSAGADHFQKIENYYGLLPAAFLLLAQGLVFGICTYLLYKKRESYAGNKNITFSFAKPVIKVCVMCAVSLFLALLFFSMSNESLGFGIFGLVSGLLLAQILMQLILEGDLRQITKGMLSFGIAAVISLLLFCFFPWNAERFDRYLPQRDNLKSVAIVRDGEYVKDIYDASCKRMQTSEFLLEHMVLTDEKVMDALLSLLQSSMEEELYHWGNINEQRTVLEWDFLNVRFDLKNGKKVFRRYCLKKEEVRELYDLYYTSKDYKKIAGPYAFDEMEAYLLNEMPYLKIGFESQLVTDHTKYTFTDRERVQQLYEAVKEDYFDRDVAALKNSFPIGNIVVLGSFIDENNVFYPVFATREISFTLPVYKTDARTMEILFEDTALTIKPDVEQVSRIDIRVVNQPDKYGKDIAYSEYAAITNNGSLLENADDQNSYTVREKNQEMEDILSICTTHDALNGLVDGNLAVDQSLSGVIFFENGETREVVFLKDALPASVKKQFNEVK